MVIVGAHPLAIVVIVDIVIIHVVILPIRIVAIEVPVIAGACFPAVKMGEASVVLGINSCVVVIVILGAHPLAIQVIHVVVKAIWIVGIEVSIIASACFPAVKMGEASVLLGINSCVVVIVIVGAHPLAIQVIHVVVKAIWIVGIEVSIIAGACFPAVKMGEASVLLWIN